ncbi:hypothetical protein ANME2D_00535 [Candidatus Methanoperedens nitroreducens]|uniref:Uncharacterized protein n=1 Tax=Candidatus Methanoperedens nitratireducens TaxID=1392998 RepID=A0A062V861_9EURY|nr:hypothetical protein ANME2D_00535 [Candidatus Methanoperedens nitroreducens]MDJ1422577.1 hypothetical protein [Candidatus Methanoperedens sp.]
MGEFHDVFKEAQKLPAGAFQDWLCRAYGSMGAALEDAPAPSKGNTLRYLRRSITELCEEWKKEKQYGEHDEEQERS